MAKIKTLKRIGIKGLYWVFIAWFLFVYYRITKNIQVDSLLRQVSAHSPTTKTSNQDCQNAQMIENSFIKEAMRINQSVVIAANHHVVLTNCLLNCFVLNAMLNHRNIENNMIVGIKHETVEVSTHANTNGNDQSNQNSPRSVSNNGRTLAGHMWIEINGVVINDSVDNIDQYRRVDQFSMHSISKH